MADIFKSSHKGTQIDETVDKVLNNNCVIKWGNVLPTGLELQTDLWNELENKALKITTINGYSLTGNITLTAEDVQALPDTTIYGRTIDNSDMTIRLKDAEGNVISSATVPTMSGNDLMIALNGKASIDLDNLTSTGEAHFANPSLNNLDPVGQQKLDNKANINFSNITNEAKTNFFTNLEISNISDEGKGNLGTFALSNYPVVDKSGTNVILEDNKINRITISGNTTFNLPGVSGDKFHQMLVLVSMPTVSTISLGTSHYFNGVAPNMSTAGNYTLIYEHNGTNWFVGGLYRGN